MMRHSRHATRNQFVGILLAAGRGSRFDPGGEQDKLLQPLATGEAVVESAAKNLLAVLPAVVAVVRPGAERVAACLQSLGCEVTMCTASDQGMGASLVHALSRAPEASGWLVALGDMPFVRHSTMQALVAALEQGHDIAAPVYCGSRGNPVGFSRRHLPHLLELRGDQGARRLLQTFPVTTITVDDPGVTLDVDTPADLASER